MPQEKAKNSSDKTAPLSVLSQREGKFEKRDLPAHLGKAFHPFLAACTANAEQSRKALIPCMICRPVNPAGFIGKSCKNPVRNKIAPRLYALGRISLKIQ